MSLGLYGYFWPIPIQGVIVCIKGQNGELPHVVKHSDLDVKEPGCVLMCTIRNGLDIQVCRYVCRLADSTMNLSALIEYLYGVSTQAVEHTESSFQTIRISALLSAEMIWENKWGFHFLAIQLLFYSASILACFLLWNCLTIDLYF